MKSDDVERLFRALKFECDVRQPPDEFRRRQFHRGWRDAMVRSAGYTPETLLQLTWRNLGYRFGETQRGQALDEVHVDGAFRALERNFRTWWVPRSREDRLLDAYWKHHGGLMYVEVPIGSRSGPDGLPTGTTRRIDAIRLCDVTTPGIRRLVAGDVPLGDVSKVELIEVKIQLNRSVIGQVIAGRDLFRRDYGRAVDRSLVLCEASDKALEWVCGQHDIVVELIHPEQ